MQRENKLIAVKISDAVIVGKELWSSCDEFNGLLYADLETGKVKIMDRFPEMPLFTHHAFGTVVKVDDILVFVPGRATAVYTYHIKKKEFQFYDLPKEMSNMSEKFKFNQAVVYGKSVFMLGYSEPCIVCFDVLDGCLTYYGEWYQDFIQRGFEHELLLIDREICILGNSLFFPPRNGDCIIEFDMEKRQCIFHEFRYKIDWYYNLYYDAGFFWTCGTKSRNIIRMNDKFEVLEELSLMEISPDMNKSPLVEGERYFRFSYKKGPFIWLFSSNFERYIQVDVEKRNLSIHSCSDSEDYCTFSFTNIKRIHDKIYVFEPLRKRLYIYNDKMEKMETFQFKTDQSAIFSHFTSGVEEQFLYEKEKCLSLDYLIWNIQNKSCSYIKEKNEKNCGAEILKLCK